MPVPSLSSRIDQCPVVGALKEVVVDFSVRSLPFSPLFCVRVESPRIPGCSSCSAVVLSFSKSSAARRRKRVREHPSRVRPDEHFPTILNGLNSRANFRKIFVDRERAFLSTITGRWHGSALPRLRLLEPNLSNPNAWSTSHGRGLSTRVASIRDVTKLSTSASRPALSPQWGFTAVELWGKWTFCEYFEKC